MNWFETNPPFFSFEDKFEFVLLGIWCWGSMGFLGGLFKGLDGFGGTLDDFGLAPLPTRLANVKVTSSCSGLSSDISWDIS